MGAPPDLLPINRGSTDVDVTIRLTLPVSDVTTWVVRRALENLAGVMLVQAEDGLYFAGYRDAEGVDNPLVCEIQRSTVHSIEPVVVTRTGTCRHCGRAIREEEGRWVDPEATGDDSIWRETCDENHEDRIAAHEPTGCRHCGAAGHHRED